MNNIRNKVYTDISTAIKAQYPSVFCCAEYLPKDASLPCFYFAQTNNYVAQRYIDSTDLEHGTEVTFEMQFFTHTKQGKISLAYDLAGVADGVMASLGFVRIYLGQTPNQNGEVFRVVSRYRGIVTGNEQDGFIVHTN